MKQDQVAGQKLGQIDVKKRAQNEWILRVRRRLYTEYASRHEDRINRSSDRPLFGPTRSGARQPAQPVRTRDDVDKKLDQWDRRQISANFLRC